MSMALQPGDRLHIDADPELLQPRSVVPVSIRRASGATESLKAIAAVETQLEVQLLREGGVIPMILKAAIREHGPGAPSRVLAA